jgi:arginine metabolism regulation protein II
MSILASQTQRKSIGRQRHIAASEPSGQPISDPYVNSATARHNRANDTSSTNAFVAYNSSASPRHLSSQSNDDDYLGIDNDNTHSQNDPDPMGYLSVTSVTDADSLLDPTSGLGWNDLFDSGFGASLPTFDHPSLEDPLNLLAHVANQPFGDMSTLSQYHQPITTYRLHSQSIPSFTTSTQRTQLPSYVQRELSEDDVFEDAKMLLKYFRDVVIPQFAPLPMPTRSPWEILVWSSAVQTHADMTYLESTDVKHASKANLFALLGCSAYHIAKTESHSDAISPERGAQIVEYVSKRAKRHMQESLRFETSGPEKAKYKDQLTAIFSLMAFAVKNTSVHSRLFD